MGHLGAAGGGVDLSIERIARLLAEGKTTRVAAPVIFVSPSTVEYTSHTYRKLGINLA